mgnify:CR=1 FL=1
MRRVSIRVGNDGNSITIGRQWSGQKPELLNFSTHMLVECPERYAKGTVGLRITGESKP